MSDYFNNELAPNKYSTSGTWIQAMMDAGFTSQTRMYYLLDWIGHDAGSNKDGWWYAALAKMFMNFVNHQSVESDERKNDELERFYLTVLEEIDNLKFVNCSDPSRVAQRAVKKVWKEFHEN